MLPEGSKITMPKSNAKSTATEMQPTTSTTGSNSSGAFRVKRVAEINGNVRTIKLGSIKSDNKSVREETASTSKRRRTNSSEAEVQFIVINSTDADAEDEGNADDAVTIYLQDEPLDIKSEIESDTEDGGTESRPPESNENVTEATKIIKVEKSDISSTSSSSEINRNEVQVNRSQTTNSKQMEIFISHMEINTDIAKGGSMRTREELGVFWERLVNDLNNAGPPCRSAFEWRKVWSDKKKYIRKKLSGNIKSSNPRGDKFTPTEQIIKRICELELSAPRCGLLMGRSVASSEKTTSSCNSTTPLNSVTTNASENMLKFAATENCHDASRKSAYLYESARSHQSHSSNGNTYTLDLLKESSNLQKEFLAELKTAVTALAANTKQLADQQQMMLQETKRHNLEMEKLRRTELDMKIQFKRQLLKLKKEKLHKT